IALLGDDIIVGQTLSREKIAQKVFADPILLKELEKRIHPEVQKAIVGHYKVALQKRAPLFVAEIPLLFEAEMQDYYDFIIVVVSDEALGKERFRYSEEEFTRRSQRLMPIEEKIKKADLVIENNQSLAELRDTVAKTFNLLTLREVS